MSDTALSNAFQFAIVASVILCTASCCLMCVIRCYFDAKDRYTYAREIWMTEQGEATRDAIREIHGDN